MTSPLTIRDLTLPGEPLEGAQSLTGEIGLDNPVVWVVSLRPFSPAFPRLRGSEIALVATENLTRHDPPITLADVVRLLRSTRGAGIAVRGGVDKATIMVAEQAGLPLLLIPSDAPLADLEQAIMRECAFHQARTEISRVEDPESWLEDLLSGRDDLLEGAVSRAERQGYTPSKSYALAFLVPMRADGGTTENLEAVTILRDTLRGSTLQQGNRLVAVPYEGGLAVLLPQGSEGVLYKTLEGAEGWACGIGTAKPLLHTLESSKEAWLAYTASSRVNKGKPTQYAELGPIRLLLLLHRDEPSELARFVNESIGPLVKHDERTANPLLPTVQAFIEHGGRLRDTAEHLYVHRNTLAYRLDRAAEILGADLRDSNVRLTIELALLAMPLITGPIP